MRLWRPFGRTEKRAAQGGGSQGGAGFTDAIVRALLTQAAGGATADPSATASLEAAAGSYARAFAVAEVTPATPATRALTPDLLALMARDLIRRGEFVHVIEVDRGGVRLTPAGSWDVRGRWDPATWRYRCDLFGPSGNVTRFLPADAVVHGRYSVDPARPWWGVSPLGWARLTGKLHANLEDAIADEASGTRGHVLPVPAGPDAENEDDDPLADLRKDIASLRGKTALVETVASGWGEGGLAAPQSDWKPQRIGANPPASLATLRTDSAMAVLAACGVSSDLFVHGDAAGQRESWRRFLHGSVQPLGDLLAAELAVKLDVPGLRLTFDRLMASDLSGRARACAGVRQLGAGGHGQGPGGAAGGSELMRTQGTPRVSAVPGAPPGRAHFLILPIGYTMADVKWLVTRDPDDSEAALEADLERDGRRRRWLGAGVAGPDSQR